MHDHRADPHFPARALHPQCDLAAISDQNFFEHNPWEVRDEAGREAVAALLLNDAKWLAVFDRLAIFNEDLFDDAADLGLDLVQ